MLNFYAVYSHEYYSRFLVLYRSIRKFHPDSGLFLYGWNTDLKPDDNNIVFTRVNNNCNDPREVFNDMQPREILRLFSEGIENIVAIGSDCELFAPLTEIEDALKEYDVILTPNIACPSKGDQISLTGLWQVGMINGDFIAIKNTDNSKKILEWYGEVCSKYFINNTSRGLFYNQIWISMIPFLFDGVKILRNRSYNTAYWNIMDYDFNYTDKKYYTPDGELKFFHYSGYDGNPARMTKYRQEEAAKGAVLKIYQEYDDKLKQIA